MNYQDPQYPPQQGYPPQQLQQPPPVQYAPQYPQAPQQGYAPQAAPAAYYPPQQQVPVAPPLATGGLDEFYDQPSAGSGPSIGWSDKLQNKRPLGFWFAGYVTRDVVSSDISQQTNPQGVPQTFRDGRPKFQMKVPLKGITCADPNVVASDFPEGEGTWYVRGQGRDELSRAMAEVGFDPRDAPKAGAFVVIQLVQRRSSGQGFQPANIVQVSYTPAGGAAPVQQVAQATVATSPAPVAQAPVAPAPLAPPAWAAPVQQQAPVPPVVMPQAPVAQAPAAQAPVPAASQGPPLVAPADMTPEQQQLLASITGQTQQAAAQG